MLIRPPILGRLNRPGPLRKASNMSPLLAPGSPVCGLRGLWRPNMGLMAMHRMGAVRHALSQRIVSGVIEVHAPWADAVARGEAEPGQRKKR